MWRCRLGGRVDSPREAAAAIGPARLGDGAASAVRLLYLCGPDAGRDPKQIRVDQLHQADVLAVGRISQPGPELPGSYPTRTASSGSLMTWSQ